MRTIGIKCALVRCALWDRVDEQFLHTTRMYLEVQRASHGVLPRLSYVTREHKNGGCFVIVINRQDREENVPLETP